MSIVFGLAIGDLGVARTDYRIAQGIASIDAGGENYRINEKNTLEERCTTDKLHI